MELQLKRVELEENPYRIALIFAVPSSPLTSNPPGSAGSRYCALAQEEEMKVYLTAPARNVPSVTPKVVEVQPPTDFNVPAASYLWEFVGGAWVKRGRCLGDGTLIPEPPVVKPPVVPGYDRKDYG